MGYGLPAAIGACLANKSRPMFALDEKVITVKYPRICDDYCAKFTGLFFCD